MSRFAIRYPYLIIVLCLITCVVGVTSLFRLPVDLFPAIKIPVVVVATFYSQPFGDNSVNSMVLGGLALAFSRLINNSVVVLENIFRHVELGEPPEIAAEKGGQEVAPEDLDVIVSNIGVTPGFSSIYTSNSAQPTATVQASLKASRRLGSYEYMDRVRRRLRSELPLCATDTRLVASAIRLWLWPQSERRGLEV